MPYLLIDGVDAAHQGVHVILHALARVQHRDQPPVFVLARLQHAGELAGAQQLREPGAYTRSLQSST